MRQFTAFVNATVIAMVCGSTAWAAAEPAKTVQVQLDPAPTVAGPIGVKTDLPESLCAIKVGEQEFIGQVDADHIAWFWWPGKDGKSPSPDGRVQIELGKDNRTPIEVKIDGKLFTQFHWAPEDTKPYLHPVIGPTGDPVTRDWPMKDTPAEKDAKRQDHPHHRSFWTAHGDIRTPAHPDKGTDYWASDAVKQEGGKRVIVHRENSGLQKVRTIANVKNGPVFAEFTAEVDWVTADGKRELTDTRTYRFFRGDDANRVIDYRIVFNFPESDVTFADTKEGGIMSIRVATTMDETAKKGGQMVNAKGGRGAKECWGKPAEWCDYVGPVDGKTVGIAVFDAPSNLRHPTTWHIRDYGLYTANPFGIKDFTGDKSKNGSHTWKKGQSATWDYRVVIHKGNTEEAGVAEQYKLYTRPLTPKSP